MHWGRQCAAPMHYRTLGRAAHRKAHRLALEEAPMQVFGVASCWKNVKICECFLTMRGFHCIGNGSLPPPPNCRAAHQKVRRLALVEAPILLFVSYSVNKMLKFVNFLLGMLSFQCTGGGSVPPPITCRTLGRAARRIARCLALADAPM